MREEISRDPIGDAQRDNMYFELVQKPNAIIMAKDEPFTAGAKQAVKAGSKSTNNREKPTNQHGTKPAKTSQKKDYSKLVAMLDHLWHVTKLDIVDMVNDMDSWKGMTADKLKPIISLTYESINKQVSGIGIDRVMFDSGIKGIFADLSDLLCRNINSTDLKGDLVYKISGVFESLRFKLSDLSEMVIIEQEESNV
jgi:hypothetical protein